MKLLAALIFVACLAWAQSTAQISGTVKYPAAAVIAGAEVAAIQTATGVKRTVTTDNTGSFVLTNLPVGPYRLEASASGFRTYVQTGIVLEVADSPVINPSLSVGQV